MGLINKIANTKIGKTLLNMGMGLYSLYSPIVQAQKNDFILLNYLNEFIEKYNTSNNKDGVSRDDFVTKKGGEYFVPYFESINTQMKTDTMVTNTTSTWDVFDVTPNYIMLQYFFLQVAYESVEEEFSNWDINDDGFTSNLDDLNGNNCIDNTDVSLRDKK